jgi:hypothetical protein
MNRSLHKGGLSHTEADDGFCPLLEGKIPFEVRLQENSKKSGRLPLQTKKGDYHFNKNPAIVSNPLKILN